jgi:hypothetical protein
VGDAPEFSTQWPSAGLVQIAIDDDGGQAVSAAYRGRRRTAGARPVRSVSGAGPADPLRRGIGHTVDAAGFGRSTPRWPNGWWRPLSTSSVQKLGSGPGPVRGCRPLHRRTGRACGRPYWHRGGVESDTTKPVWDAAANLQPPIPGPPSGGTG